MKIAIVGSRHLLSGYSGIERGLSKVLPILAQRGHKVTVFGGPLPDGSMGTGSCWKGVNIEVIQGYRGKHVETLSRSALAVGNAIRGGFDVIHYQHQGPGVFVPITKLARLPSVVTVCGLDWKRAKWGRPAKAAIHAAERIAVRWADELVVVSKKIHDYFKESYGRETTYIPNGFEKKSPPTTTSGLCKYGLDPNGYVLFAARLVPEKGCHELLEAWRTIETDKKLVIAGAGRYDSDYADRLREIADPSKVIFTGHIEGDVLDELFGHAYLFVLPSHVEGLSIALLEAMGYGRAALVSDIPENLEVLEGNGFSFKVGDVRSLREHLSALITDEERVRAMARQVATACGKLSWNDVALQHELVYASVLKKKPFTTRGPL